MEPFQLLHSNDGIARNLKQMLTSVLLSFKEISVFSMLKSLHHIVSISLWLKKNIHKNIQTQLYAAWELECRKWTAHAKGTTWKFDLSERMSCFQNH